MTSVAASLAWAHPLVAEWFVQKFGTPTEPQEQGWPHILAGRTTLISAPTGSGKTLAAFLACIDRLVRKALAGELSDRTEALYVSPLKALGNDSQTNLEAPLREIMELAGAQGLLMPEIRSAVRTGDTLQPERRAMLKRPPHILVTTPESLYILLTAEKSRAILKDVETVIVDEIHAVADDKRGSHLALSLERLDALVTASHPERRAPVRIGLSATQKPIELVASFLAGAARPQPAIVDIGHRRAVDLVCQIGSTRSIAVALQRVGRAGHWRGAVPKGRVFAMTRDELVECAALARAIRHGRLDRLEIPEAPLDVLAQQVVAACACEDWNEEELFRLVRRAYPYRELSRA